MAYRLISIDFHDGKFVCIPDMHCSRTIKDVREEISRKLNMPGLQGSRISLGYSCGTMKPVQMLSQCTTLESAIDWIIQNTPTTRDDLSLVVPLRGVIQESLAVPAG